MSRDLETLIEKRKTRAYSKKIPGKAELVARYLGNSIYSSDKHIELDRKYSDNFLEVRLIESTSSDIDFSGVVFKTLEIKYKGDVVFRNNTMGGISSYKPGYWERKLNKIHEEQAKPLCEADERRKKSLKEASIAQKEETIRNKWGL